MLASAQNADGKVKQETAALYQRRSIIGMKRYLAMSEKHVIEELGNIYKNQPLFPGNTISHATANECVERGWAKRNDNGDFVITLDGMCILSEADVMGMPK